MELTIVSGLSGSGKTVALQALEDIGYYCIDNLPANLLPHFAASLMNHPGSRAAVDYVDFTVGRLLRRPFSRDPARQP